MILCEVEVRVLEEWVRGNARDHVHGTPMSPESGIQFLDLPTNCLLSRAAAYKITIIESNYNSTTSMQSSISSISTSISFSLLVFLLSDDS